MLYKNRTVKHRSSQTDVTTYHLPTCLHQSLT